jgi:hypothetical protein
VNGLGARAPRPPPEFMLMLSGEELAVPVATEEAEEAPTEGEGEAEPEDDPCAEGGGGSGRGCKVLLGGRIPLVLRMAALDKDLVR